MKLTELQNQARKMLGSKVGNTLLAGGSRSGKTMVICRRLLSNALRVPCRQVIMRRYFNTVRSSVGMDTMPKLIKMLGHEKFFSLNKSDWIFSVTGCEGEGSEIWLLGLDDQERADKVLGMEFATIFFNECSEISWGSIETASGRLAQKVPGLKNRTYFDCNPTVKTHWTHRVFVDKVHPLTRIPLAVPENWQWMRMNPEDNLENLPADYLQTLEGLSQKKRQRFLLGQWQESNENALWRRETMIDPFRANSAPDDLEMIAVAVDPSGGGGPGNCDTGIVVVGSKKIGPDRHFYVLADGTTVGTPHIWGTTAVALYNQYRADVIVAETNYGGAMVEQVIKSIEGGSRCGYKSVTASRGKIVRAEPIATQYDRGLVHHVGAFDEMEDEMCSFTGSASDESPNRMDALVWAITYLMEPQAGSVEKTSNFYGVF